MTPQPDPAIVRAVLNKHTNDNDRPSACETCCLELNRTRTAIRDMADEMDKLRPTSRLAVVVADDLYRILGERP